MAPSSLKVPQVRAVHHHNMKAPPDGKLQESPLPAPVRFWEFWHEQTLEHLIDCFPSQVCFVVFETKPR